MQIRVNLNEHLEMRHLEMRTKQEEERLGLGHGTRLGLGHGTRLGPRD